MTDFQEAVWSHYRENGRDLPWRQTTDPYHIWISEVMLQQTQVGRVVPKYRAFLKRFPDPQALADADLREVLQEWSGLGYNRRAKFLHQAARRITTEHGGAVPRSVEALQALPGLGYNTAAAIAVYAYGAPLAFIETNIRAVFIHHFFPDQDSITDQELLPLVEKTLDRVNPREWYWALMDYGTYLKRMLPNPSRASRHHTRQSRFEGSRRQVRGLVAKALLAESPLGLAELSRRIDRPRELVEDVACDLVNEGMIQVDASGKFRV